jgi:aminopeptidase-like protein
VGQLSRSRHGTYPEYHTSADDLSFVDVAQVQQAVDVVAELFEALEDRVTPWSRRPLGEPHLADHGLFRSTGGSLAADAPEHAYLWVLSLADGRHDLQGIAERSGLSTATIDTALKQLWAAGLIEV